MFSDLSGGTVREQCPGTMETQLKAVQNPGNTSNRPVNRAL